ncbi:MAG TPA: RdgB/HAM1 family non-canonical purine NTP pyrophosphatase [Rhodothermales bacterium]
MLIASGNSGKIEEIRLALSGLAVEIRTAADIGHLPEVAESEDTLEGNARLKSETLFQAAGLPVLSDDTGLEVAALGGDPGVRSARFAGEPSDQARNRALLLELMAARTDRSARFRTVVAFTDESGTYLFDGSCDGVITCNGRGTGGFGYDELFEPEGLDRTFAEIDPMLKNAISHRGKALRLFVKFLTHHWKLGGSY